VDVPTQPNMEGQRLSEDDEYRRKPRTRAVDPISRGLLASAESHQDFVDKSHTLLNYLLNPLVDLAIAGALLLSPLLTYWFLANVTTTILVVLVEACILLTVFWLGWRAWRRDKSAAASRTK
jgi:hypothetical protein